MNAGNARQYTEYALRGELHYAALVHPLHPLRALTTHTSSSFRCSALDRLPKYRHPHRHPVPAVRLASEVRSDTVLRFVFFFLKDRPPPKSSSFPQRAPFPI